MEIPLLEKLLCLYVIFIPLMKAPILPLLKEKLQYTEILFIFFSGAWLISFFMKKVKLQRIPLAVPLILMLGLFLPSFLNSNMRLVSLIDFLGIAYLVVFYFLLAQVIRTEEAWWRIVKCWVIVSLIVSAAGLFSYLVFIFGGENSPMVMQPFNFPEHLLRYRLSASFRHPAMLAAYLHTSIVFGFVLAGYYNRSGSKKKWWAYSAVILCFIASALTKTRVLTGITLTLFLILNSLGPKKIIASLLKYAAFLCFVFMFIFTFFITVWWIFPVKVNMDNESNRLRIELNSTHQTYFIQHKAALDMFLHHPLIGVGMGMYNYKSVDYVKWKDAFKPYQVMSPDIKEADRHIYAAGHDPHSVPLGWGAETGLLGLGGIIGFFFFLLNNLFKAAKASGGKYFYYCFIAGIAGFLLNGLFIDILTMRHFWFLIGMALILQKQERTNHAHS